MTRFELALGKSFPLDECKEDVPMTHTTPSTLSGLASMMQHPIWRERAVQLQHDALLRMMQQEERRRQEYLQQTYWVKAQDTLPVQFRPHC